MVRTKDMVRFTLTGWDAQEYSLAGQGQFRQYSQRGFKISVKICKKEDF